MQPINLQNIKRCNIVNFKVFTQQLREPRATMKLRQGSISLFTLFLLCNVSSISEAHHIDWDTLNLSPQQESQMQHLESNWEKTHQEVNGQIEKDMAEMKEI